MASESWKVSASCKRRATSSSGGIGSRTAWTANSHDYYFRQLWDWKVSADVDNMAPEALLVYAKMCGWALARAHARSGDRVAIASYLGSGDAFDRAIADFAVAYADQNALDQQALVDAIKDGSVQAELGV